MTKEEKVNQGLKRHPGLVSLSRHHHEALRMSLFVSKLTVDEGEERILEERSKWLTFWSKGGQDHFREEEEILVPTYGLYASLDQPDVIQLMVEHAQIRSRFIAVEKMTTGNAELLAALQELGVMLEKHVRLEERVVFPMIEAALPADEWKRLAPLLHHDDDKYPLPT